MKTTRRWRWSLVAAAWLLAVLPSAQAFYDPGAQRWINRDPLGELGLGVLTSHSAENQDEFAELLPEGPNLYAVVGNKPIHTIDADGRARKWELPEPPSFPLPGGRSVKPTFTYIFYPNPGCPQWWACLISGPPDPPDTVVIHPRDPARFSKCMALAREIWNNAGFQPYTPPNTAQLDRACNYAGKCYRKYW